MQGYWSNHKHPPIYWMAFHWPRSRNAGEWCSAPVRPRHVRSSSLACRSRGDPDYATTPVPALLVGIAEDEGDVVQAEAVVVVGSTRSVIVRFGVVHLELRCQESHWCCIIRSLGLVEALPGSAPTAPMAPPKAQLRAVPPGAAGWRSERILLILAKDPLSSTEKKDAGQRKERSWDMYMLRILNGVGGWQWCRHHRR